MKTVSCGVVTASLFLSATSVLAQDVTSQSIDDALFGQVDFRQTAFATCIGGSECEVAGVTILAERLNGTTGGWEPAELYWDPIDGFGVQGGNQNDEIDVDERLVVQFSSPVSARGIWLSDLFISEFGRYQVENDTIDDAEIADFELFAGESTLMQARLSGQIDLPRDPFNELFPEIFVEDGDLLNRIVIEPETISIYMPDPDGTGVVTLPLGEIDKDKQQIFAGVETVEIDIAELLGGVTEITVFKKGSENAKRILAARDNLASLERLRQAAGDARRVGSISNGEVGWYPQAALPVDRIVFTTEAMSSNDYSVAGIVIEE